MTTPTRRLVRERGLKGPVGALALAGSLLVAGCLGSPQPTIDFLTLPRISAPSGGDSRSPEAPSVGLGPVSVAAHLERRYLAYRIDESRVEFADSAQWAAPVERMVSQYLAGRLAERFGPENVREFPWTQRGAPDLQLTLHLEEFAVDPAGEVTVAARWGLRDPLTGEGLDGGSWTRSGSPAGASASRQVAALSAILDELADFLADRLREGAAR